MNIASYHWLANSNSCMLYIYSRKFVPVVNSRKDELLPGKMGSTIKEQPDCDCATTKKISASIKMSQVANDVTNGDQWSRWHSSLSREKRTIKHW